MSADQSKISKSYPSGQVEATVSGQSCAFPPAPINNRTGTSLKVPSDISYEGGRLSKWGYQVRQFTEAYRGIKLLLDVSQRVKYTPSTESKALLKENGIPVRHAVRDYLKQLIEYTKQVLQRQIAIDAAQMNLQFVLTVPAVWSEKAKQMTLEAAVAAGADFKIISLVSEPEAAALYTPRAIQPNTLAVCHPESHTKLYLVLTEETNDVFIVCDAGGGTVVSSISTTG